ncbi:MAG: glycosyltransferase family protein [Candidatus Staskawiczbacteria bacterium]|nr:glycosyltransferase family protein [Candidatus Staskawiczbacteria bacterium]
MLAVIIQARMGASRLPGKVLMKIGKKTVLQWVVERIKMVPSVDGIIVATSDKKQDDLIEKFCKKNNIECFRGSEDDVLSRYFEASKVCGADIILRITADCPFVDPVIIEEIIKIHLKNKNDCTMNNTGSSYPRGSDVELFNFKSLEIAYLKAKKKYQREHVSPYIYEHPNLFKVEILEAKGMLNRPTYRFCLDTKEDLAEIRKIYSLLSKEKKEINTINIIKLLDAHPEVVKINAEVKQKKVGE